MFKKQNLDSATSGLENLESTPVQPENLERVNELCLKPELLQTFDSKDSSEIKITENPEILESNVFGRAQEQVIAPLEVLATMRSLEL